MLRLLFAGAALDFLIYTMVFPRGLTLPLFSFYSPPITYQLYLILFSFCFADNMKIFRSVPDLLYILLLQRNLVRLNHGCFHNNKSNFFVGVSLFLRKELESYSKVPVHASVFLNGFVTLRVLGL